MVQSDYSVSSLSEKESIERERESLTIGGYFSTKPVGLTSKLLPLVYSSFEHTSLFCDQYAMLLYVANISLPLSFALLWLLFCFVRNNKFQF